MNRSSPPAHHDAGQVIKERMRQALRRSDDPEAREAVRTRLESSAPTLIPARADLEPEERVRLFIEQAKAVHADIERVESYTDLPEAIARYLRRHNLPMRLVRAADNHLDQIDWEDGLFEIRTGRPDADDPVGLNAAFAGIAETGTLMLASDTDHPTTLSFLPETAIIVLPNDRVARAYEDALHNFRASGADLPRSINMITGPSRSGDIEQTLQLGAHGPKRLLIILVNEASGKGSIADIPSSISNR
ncbi:MAG: LUD domain-containing protein [Pseudomonadota bacterium]